MFLGQSDAERTRESELNVKQQELQWQRKKRGRKNPSSSHGARGKALFRIPLPF